MRVVIAAWHLEDFNVGLGRYSRDLIEAIGRVDQKHTYDVLMPNGSYQFPQRGNFRYRVVRFPFFKRRVWEQTAHLLVGKYDVLHLPYDSGIAWKRGALVLTVHDVKPLIFDELKPRRNFNSLIEEFVVGNKWDRVDHILTDSRCSRQDIVERVGYPEPRISVVHPGVDLEAFHPADGPTGSPPDSIEQGALESPGSIRNGGSSLSTSHRRSYVLSVAGGDPTKNLETLIDAFARLPLPLRDACDLVLAGDLQRRLDLRERAALAGIEKQTSFIGRVTDAELVRLYQQAALFVFPSRYEGFGLPVLEAMACGCPVVSSNASSLPEVVGDAALLIDPQDAAGFARAIEQVLMDPQIRQDLRERGLARAAQFSWDRTARETVAVYEQVAARM